MQLNDVNNNYLYRVNLIMPRLQDIYDGKIAYQPDDYPVLINTFERLYKGLCVELKHLYPDKNPYKNMENSDFMRTHRISPFAQKVNMTIPLSKNKEGIYKIYDRLDELGDRYTKSRFSEEFPFSEFQSDFRRLNSQYHRFINELEKIKAEKEYETNEMEYWS